MEYEKAIAILKKLLDRKSLDAEEKRSSDDRHRSAQFRFLS